MGKSALNVTLTVSTAAAAMIALGGPAAAQGARPSDVNHAAEPTGDEIIVTARKREEFLHEVPIIEHVLTADQLQRQQVVDLKDVARLTPGLLIGTSVLSIGQQVSIRGVGTSSADPGIDQSVSLNIDGLSLGQGLAYSSGAFDLAQVEVLKGPQALYYGKSSTGGVISLRTADPTDRFEVIVRAAYELEAHTRRGELIVSGPVTETLKLRLAGMWQKSDGYYLNRAVGNPALGGLTPRYDRMGRSQSWQLRGTALFAPDDGFDARLKVNVVHDRAINAENFQFTSCPDGIAGSLGIQFFAPTEDCRKDRVGYIVDYNPVFYPGVINGGVPLVETDQQYGSLEMNYRKIPGVTVTSLTGLYFLQSQSLLNTNELGFAGPILAAQNPRFRRREFTQELRANSDFAGPLNFTLGAYYQSARVSNWVSLIAATYPALTGIPGFGPGALQPLQDALNRFTIRTFSLFGQARYQITPELELSGGVRWADERRKQNPRLLPSAAYFPLLTVPGTSDVARMPTPVVQSSTWSPEFTLTYKPTADLTAFASYKRAYKSGSFSIATPPTILSPNALCLVSQSCAYLDNAFQDERVEGGEIGLKGRFADRQLDISLAGFHYVYKGLQVGSVEPARGGVPIIRTVNAGSGKVTGAELSAAFSPRAMQGLTVNGALTYTHARFNVLDNAPCYGGQTIAAGCTKQPDPTTGLFFAQDLAGFAFVRAPDWQANFGFNYEMPVGRALKLSLSNTNYYSTDYPVALAARRDFYQEGVWKHDASIALADRDDRWEVAVIGKNLTRKYTTSSCITANYANGSLGGQITGGTGAGPAGVDEVGCLMDPGPEIWLRLTFRPVK